jgi:hypothetical protein
MRPSPVPTPADGETDMFRNRLDNMIDMRHDLVRLTGLIDWKRFDEAFGDLYAEKGRPGVTHPTDGRAASAQTRTRITGYGDGVDGAPSGLDVPRWSLSQTHLREAVHGQV